MIIKRDSSSSSSSSLISHPSFLIFALVCALLFCGCAVEARAQQDVQLPPIPAPPPMKYIPEGVRAELGAARDAKARTRLSLDLMETRLASAESHTAAQQYDAAAAELGVFQALAADVLAYLQQVGKSDGKTRDLYKLVEQALYKYGGRIEVMRRNTPSDYIGNVRAAFNHTRDTRTAALNAFYGNTVLREPPPDKTKPAPKEPEQERPAPV